MPVSRYGLCNRFSGDAGTSVAEDDDRNVACRFEEIIRRWWLRLYGVTEKSIEGPVSLAVPGCARIRWVKVKDISGPGPDHFENITVNGSSRTTDDPAIDLSGDVPESCLGP